MDVGIFPEDTGVIHGLVALITSVTSSLSAIAAYKLDKRPFTYISVVIGAFSLLVLFLAFFMGESLPFWLVFGMGRGVICSLSGAAMAY